MNTDLLNNIINGATELRKEHPCYRWGQAVFNYVDEHYGKTARNVQFIDGVDCFYNDEEVDNFINHCIYYILKEAKK